MRKIFAAAWLSLSLLVLPAQAANVNIPDLPAASSVAAADLFECYQTATNRKCTSAQINTYIQGLWGAGCATFLTTPSSANLRSCLTDEVGTGAFYTVGGALGTPASGTATNLTGLPISTGLTGAGTGVLTALGVNIGSAGAPVLFNGAGGTPSAITLTNGTGLTIAGLTGLGTGVGTWLATPSSANLASAVTGETGTGALVFGTLPDITTGFTIGGAAASGNYVRGDGSKFVSSAIQAADLPALTVTTRTETGTNPALPSSDQAKVVYLSNASASAPTLPQAGTSGWTAGVFSTYCNVAAGIQTITPATSTIGGAATLAIPAGSAASPRCWNVISNGTNYDIVPAGNVYLIASGTSALGTGAITSATCATAVTTSAPGVVTGDVILAGWNGDPTGVTGYVPLTSGALTIYPYPSANNVNFKVCNYTTGSITPGAITLNWRVMR